MRRRIEDSTGCEVQKQMQISRWMLVASARNDSGYVGPIPEGTRRQIAGENEWEAIGGIASRVPGVLSLRHGEPQRI